jgi:hypothetical protein
MGVSAHPLPSGTGQLKCRWAAGRRPLTKVAAAKHADCFPPNSAVCLEQEPPAPGSAPNLWTRPLSRSVVPAISHLVSCMQWWWLLFASPSGLVATTSSASVLRFYSKLIMRVYGHSSTTAFLWGSVSAEKITSILQGNQKKFFLEMLSYMVQRTQTHAADAPSGENQKTLMGYDSFWTRIFLLIIQFDRESIMCSLLLRAPMLS